MSQNKIKIGAVASSAFAALLISCASDDRDTPEQSVVPQTTTNAPSTGSASGGSDVANTEALLLAARASAGAARTDAKSCFDKVQACKGDAGMIDQACLDMLQGCMPKAAPKPIDCKAITDLTPEQIDEIDEAVGVADGLIDDAIDFATGAIDAFLDSGIVLPDGGIAFPVGHGGGQAGRPGSRKGRDDAGVAVGPRGPSSSRGDARGDAGVPAKPARPTIDPDASIPGGELCGVPLPAIPVGALAACADKAASALKSGGDLVAIATDAFTCIEAPFKDDIAKLCTEGKAECAKAGAPPNICANVTEICGALAP